MDIKLLTMTWLSNKQKVQEVLNRLDGKVKMDSNEKDILMAKIVVTGLAVVLTVLISAITTYNCIDRIMTGHVIKSTQETVTPTK